MRFSSVVQRVPKVRLKPDIGCFVTFEGGFSGLVVMNFSAGAAMEIYSKYMTSMGMSLEDLATIYTSKEVGDSLGELMNQCVGRFQQEVETQLDISVKQSQPKMLVLNQELVISIDAKLDHPESRKVAFSTANHKPFYIELSMEPTEFMNVFPSRQRSAEDVDDVLEAHRRDAGEGKTGNDTPVAAAEEVDADSLLADLGL